jgi:hypothetical protein
MDIFLLYNSDMKTAAKHGRGRPPKGSGPTKSKGILLRLDEKEKEAFKEAADIAGLSLAGWIRERLRRAAVRELEEAARPIAFLH